MRRLLSRLHHRARDLHERRGEAVGPRSAPPENGASFETLEPRVLLSAFTWSAQEVYFLELVNRARANPVAEAERLNIDLTSGLSLDEINRIRPVEPLALNPILTTAARAHNADMAARGFFDHVNPDGDNPTDRARDAGYLGSAGENIAAGWDSIDEAHTELLISPGHRKNILSLHTSFDANFHYDEIGVAVDLFETGPYFRYYGQLYGYQGPDPEVYILGVAYDDQNSDEFYTIGEGLGNVTVRLTRSGEPDSVVAEYVTNDAGNFQIAVPGAGDYVVSYINGATNLKYQAAVTVGTENVKSDVLLAQMTTPVDVPEEPEPPVIVDDHADADDLANATVMEVHRGTGDAGQFGTLEIAGDTDVFMFSPIGTGSAAVTLGPGLGLIADVRVLDADGNLIVAGTPGGVLETGSIASFNVEVGRTYYIVVEARPGSDADTGLYGLLVEGPLVDGSGEPSSGGGDSGGGDSGGGDSGGGDSGGGDSGGGDSGGENPSSSRPVDAAGPGQAVFGTVTSGGSLALVTLNEIDRPILFTETEDGWAGVDLGVTADFSAYGGGITTWTDPKNGLTTIAVATTDGLLLFREESDGSWTVRDLLDELPAAEAVQGGMAYYVTPDNRLGLAGVNASGDVLLFYQRAVLDDSGQDWRWGFANLSESHFRARDLEAPTFVGQLTAYTTPWNARHIAGLDAEGNLRQLGWAPGVGAYWRTANLTANTGGPALTGNVAVLSTPNGQLNVLGADDDGTLFRTYWQPGFGGQWVTENVREIAAGPALDPTSLAAYMTPWGAINVAGVDAGGNVMVYGLNQTRGGWKAFDLSANFVGDSARPTGKLTAAAAGGAGLNLLGQSEDGDVLHMFWRAGMDAWEVANLTRLDLF